MSLFDNPALQAMKQQLDSEKDILTGKVKTTRQSFGFIEEVDGDRTIFAPPPIMKTLLPGDVVEIIVGTEDDREFVQEVRTLISSKTDSLIGRVKVTEKNGKVRKHFISNDPTLSERFAIFGGLYHSLEDNDWIEVKVTEHALTGKMFKVKPVKLISNEADPMFPWNFVKNTMAVNSNIESLVSGSTIADSYKDLYEDRTSVPYVTIDGPNTMDVDDAPYAKDLGDSYFLSVAIADPSELMEASEEQFELILNRAFSFYLPKDTIHMLARDMAENKYSLIEGDARQALCVDWKLDKKNLDIIESKVALCYICSKGKLSYQEVSEFIQQPDMNQVWANSVMVLAEIAPKLRERRSKTQSLFEDRIDYSFVFDGFEPIDLKAKHSSLADTIVEEVMILSNTFMGEFAEKKGIQVIYNTNAGFKAESLVTLQEILNEIDLALSDDEIFEMRNIVAIQNRLKSDVIAAKESGNIKAIFEAEKRLGKLRGCFEKSVLKATPEAQKVMGVKRYATWTSPLRKAGDSITHINIKRWLAGRKQIEITDDMLSILNEQNINSRASERTLTKMLYAKLFRNNPDLIKSGVVKRVGKQNCLIEISDLGVFASLPLKSVRFETRPEIDLEKGCVVVNDKAVVSEGESINIKFLRSELLYNDIEVTLAL